MESKGLLGEHQVAEIPSRLYVVLQLASMRTGIQNLYFFKKICLNNEGLITLTRIFNDGSASASRPAVTQAEAPPAKKGM